MQQLSETLKMIKIEHSIFALPFALASAFIAAGGMPEFRILLLIILAMITARSAAMAFNRFLDAEIDAANPRTAERSIPAGRLSAHYALGFTAVCSLLFIGVTWLINNLAFFLSPLLLFVLLGYSYTKRFTQYSHVVLGVALGLAPVGAWVAVRGEISFVSIFLGIAVTLWTAGFDIIYSCQDIEFDRENNLYSIPVLFGKARALNISRAFHFFTVIILIALGFHLGFSQIYWIGLGVVSLCLIYEHWLVRGGNLQHVNAAFFLMNGIVSVVFGLAVIIDSLG